MLEKISEPQTNSYGGKWTFEKLDILESYLDAYTTVLKNKPFKLIYIDAFAGTGYINLVKGNRDAKYFVAGSVSRAIKIGDKPFDKFIFIEKKNNRFNELQNLRENHPDRGIIVENSDANSYLQNLRMDWRSWRGVLFLDPFATEVEWSTIQTIANFNALDTWLLFPVSAISRILPRSRKPDDIDLRWVHRLNRIFGNESWRNLYQKNPQGDMFDSTGDFRNSGIDGLLSIYKENLDELFGKRFMPKSKTLKTSNGAPLFEFIFCAGHPKGAQIAKKIAGHIIDSSGF